MRRSLKCCLFASGLLLLACAAPDPKQELDVSEVEGYWVVDSPIGSTQRISPAIRFTLTNKSARRPIQATVTFRREGDEWGGAFLQIAAAGKPMEIGERRVLVLVADSHYTAQGPPENMFEHGSFRDARAEMFIRLGSSQWVKMAAVEMERRLGTRALDEAAAPAPKP